MDDSTILAAVISAAVLIIGGLLRISYQSGKIREGVKGVYERVNRIERWIDGRKDRQQ